MRECCCPSGPAGKHQEESPKRMSLRGPCGAQLPDRKSEARSPSGGPAGHHQQVEVRSAVTLSAGYPEALVPPGALRGTATAKGPTRGLPPGALRGTTVARSPPPTVCYIVCSSIFVIVCCSVSGSRSEDRSLSDAPLARAQSARGAADVSGTMRRASGALTVCSTA